MARLSSLRARYQRVTKYRRMPFSRYSGAVEMLLVQHYETTAHVSYWVARDAALAKIKQHKALLKRFQKEGLTPSQAAGRLPAHRY